MAAIMLTTIWFCKPNYFQHLYFFLGSVLFLVIFPVLAYPLQPFIPKYKERGREGQRILAMIFAVAGYLLGCITNLFFHSTIELWFIYLEYRVSGIPIFLLNKCFHIIVSGHACGVCGPIALLFVFGIYEVTVPGLILILLVYLSSIKTGRHSIWQLIGGSIIPLAVILFLQLLF